jgi:hypothetical protein
VSGRLPRIENEKLRKAVKDALIIGNGFYTGDTYSG